MNNFEQRLELLMKAKLKKIKMGDMAVHLQCSTSWISQHFSNKSTLAPDDQVKLTKFINEYQK